MSMQKVLVSVPSLRPVPRGAIWAGQVATWLQSFSEEVRAVLAVTAESARVRAAAAREARNRADLMAMARQYQGTQPEFAKDLFAAASHYRST